MPFFFSFVASVREKISVARAGHNSWIYTLMLKCNDYIRAGSGKSG